MNSLLIVTARGVVNADTGEVAEGLTEGEFLRLGGGTIAGRNLYPLVAGYMNGVRTAGDSGWTGKIHAQEQRSAKGEARVKGAIYFSHLTYRHPKRKHKRAPATKYLILNLELFTESEDLESAARDILKLCRRRGVTPRYSPGSLGSALLRGSPEWQRLRRPAPHFISAAARPHLPGNYYALRPGYRKVAKAYYVDQQSSHHTVASTIDLPHPHYLRARGRFRAVEAERYPDTYRDLGTLDRHVGLIVARVRCARIPQQYSHLYPEWMREPGVHVRWIWTPELRLLDDKVSVEGVTAALTSVRADPALSEYARWSLTQLAEPHNSAIKPALLAAYGMLAVRSDRDLTLYAAHAQEPPPRWKQTKLPLLDRAYRSTVRSRVPAIQNVIARGVIEAEVRTRSIEYARELESEGIPVVHVYADGVIAATDQLPLPPPGWRIAGALTNVTSPAPHSILSAELVRLPGIPNGRRTAYMRADREGERRPGERPSHHLRECEPRPVVV